MIFFPLACRTPSGGSIGFKAATAAALMNQACVFVKQTRLWRSTRGEFVFVLYLQHSGRCLLLHVTKRPPKLHNLGGTQYFSYSHLIYFFWLSARTWFAQTTESHKKSNLFKADYITLWECITLLFYRPSFCHFHRLFFTPNWKKLVCIII